MQEEQEPTGPKLSGWAWRRPITPSTKRDGRSRCSLLSRLRRNRRRPRRRKSRRVRSKPEALIPTRPHLLSPAGKPQKRRPISTSEQLWLVRTLPIIRLTGDYFRVGCKPTRSWPVHARLECKSLMGNGIGKILPATHREH